MLGLWDDNNPQHPKCLQSEGLRFQNPLISGLLQSNALEDDLGLVDVQGKKAFGHQNEAFKRTFGGAIWRLLI